jgi:uncharacterized tellurite resistance protein B-like protein
MDDKTYQLGLLYLAHLLINADGVVNENEEKALVKICEKEKIPADVVDEFQREIKITKPRDVYQRAVEMINACDDRRKLRAFVHLFKMSEVDGSVHVKEVRLLLYSIKMAEIEFNDVVAAASKISDY